MQRAQERGKAGNGRRARVALLACAAASCALFVLSAGSGCNPGSKVAANGDPLVGEMHPQPKLYTIDKGTSPQQRAQKSKAAPPLPEAISASSQAAVAQGDPLTGDPPPLALASPGARPAGGWQATGTDAGRNDFLASKRGAPQLGAAPTLRAPEPVPFAPRADGAQGPSAVVPAGAGPASPAAGWDYDQLQAQLRARRVTWHRLESFGDGFKFTCQYVPDPAHPDFHRMYEATARDYRSAILAVIERIDRGAPGR